MYAKNSAAMCTAKLRRRVSSKTGPGMSAPHDGATHLASKHSDNELLLAVLLAELLG